MVGEVFGGISAFKAMLDIAKSIKDMNDTSVRQGISIELREQILAAQEAQSALIEQVGALKAEVTKFETWETEKQKYELKDLGWGALAYVLKPEARRGEPPHWVCTHCFGERKISIIQNVFEEGFGKCLICPACKNKISPSHDSRDGDGYKWLDAEKP